MPVERTTPQLVKKGKGKKRPGYRGPGGYQGGRSSRSRGPSGPPGGGATSMGSGRDFSKGPSSTNREKAIMSRGKGPKGTTGNIRDFKDTGPDRSKVSQFSTYGRNLMNQNLTRDNPARKRGLGGLGSLIMSGLGMLMGIPGLGLLTGGFGKLKKGLGSLNDQIQSTDFARSKTLMDYLDAKKYGGIDARDRAASKNMREARAIQTAMDMRPTTLDPREMARMGLQMPTAPMSKPTFSDPFANTVGTTTKVNAPSNDAVSSVTPDYSGIQDYGVDINVSNNPNSFSKNVATHLDNNAKFAAARDAGLISDKDYNTLGGYDVTQQLAGGNPIVGGLLNMFGSPVYNTLQGFMDTAGQPRKDIADMNEDGSVSFTSTPTSSQQLGAIPGTATRNTLGGFGLMSPELKTTYYDILNPQDFADGGLASMFTRRG